MFEGLNLLDVIYSGGRLLALASFVYFLYLMVTACRVLNVFSAETLHHFVRRAGSQGLLALDGARDDTRMRGDREPATPSTR